MTTATYTSLEAQQRDRLDRLGRFLDGGTLGQPARPRLRLVYLEINDDETGYQGEPREALGDLIASAITSGIQTIASLSILTALAAGAIASLVFLGAFVVLSAQSGHTAGSIQFTALVHSTPAAGLFDAGTAFVNGVSAFINGVFPTLRVR